jgi:hypothetical protein
MGFLDKAKNVARKGVAQSLTDAAMSVVDKTTSGDDGPSAARRFIREYGLSGTSAASALKGIEGEIGTGEVEFFWAGWLVKYGAGNGWAPYTNAAGGAAGVAYCVLSEGRVLFADDDGALLFEHRPAPGDRPEVKFVNQVIFGVVPKSKTDYGRAGSSKIYSYIGNMNVQLRPSEATEWAEYQGAVVTVPASEGHGAIDMVVLTGELDGIVAALSA